MPIRAINLHGYKLVQMVEVGSRECQRYFSDGRVTAIWQKNGNVAVKNTGIFDHVTSKRALYRVAICLRGLKLIPPSIHEHAKQEWEAEERRMEVVRLQSDADALGFTIKPAVVKVKK